MSRNFSKEEIQVVLKNTVLSKNIMLLVLLLSFAFVSALGLIYTKSLYRYYFIELQKLETIRDNLHTEWTQLLLEESTWASHTRIAHIATTELNMKDPDPDEIQIIIPKERASTVTP
jgi:cell division protein FtsL